jgi:iron complex transport system substrate-binding protein
LLITLLGLLLPACTREPSPPSTHAAAATSAPSAAGPRIVSTVPAATLNLLLLGAADELVGVTRYDTVFLPPAQQNLPVVGDYESMDYEQLAALRPTALIIQIAPSRISPRLQELTSSHHIELVNLRFDHISDIWESARVLGRISGRQQAAEKAIASAQQDLKEIAIQYAPPPPPAKPTRVLYLVSPRLLLVAGAQTFIDEMITCAGAQNVGARAGEGFLEMGREALINLQPDVLLIGAADEAEMQPNDPRMTPWMTLPVPAARAKRIYLVTDGNALMASVDIARNVRTLAELIHRGEPPDTAPFPTPPASQPAVRP